MPGVSVYPVISELLAVHSLGKGAYCVESFPLRPHQAPAVALNPRSHKRVLVSPGGSQNKMNSREC